MINRTFVLLCSLIFFPPLTSLAQEGSGGVFTYLKSEPMTLFDAGMKTIRKQAFETAAYFSARPHLDATASVTYKPTLQNIEVVLDIDSEAEVNKKRCLDLRKQAILKMLRLTVSSASTSETIRERILRRLGGQFAHEPHGSFHEFVALGERLAKATYYSIKLSEKGDPSITVTCRGLIADPLTEKF